VRNRCAGLRRYAHVRGEKDLAITATPREKPVRFPALCSSRVRRVAVPVLLVGQAVAPAKNTIRWKVRCHQALEYSSGCRQQDLAKRTHFDRQLYELNGPVYFRSNPKTTPIEPMPQPGSPPGQWHLKLSGVRGQLCGAAWKPADRMSCGPAAVRITHASVLPAS
jgi:hypothetical protein